MNNSYKPGDRVVSCWVNISDVEKKPFYKRGTVTKVLDDGNKVHILMDGEEGNIQSYQVGEHLYLEEVFDSPLFQQLKEDQ